MRNTLLAAVALFGLTVSTAALADDSGFGGSQTQDQQSVNAYLDQQSTNAQDADPTAPDSIRSHGHP